MSRQTAPARQRQPLSRRHFIGRIITGFALAGAAIPAMARERDLGFLLFAQGGGKISKADAHYQDKPNNGQQCAGCVHFQAPDRCQIVEGTVSPRGWCSNFKSGTGR
ncbi:MAG TPA: high-potential iron-sulfur protein [Xanthobacteraceae bacterium]|nr:high-potential iron-sulfur protein [Xanthobacteraceae bacterium]